jgi:cytochrome c oxidase subunit 2
MLNPERKIDNPPLPFRQGKMIATVISCCRHAYIKCLSIGVFIFLSTLALPLQAGSRDKNLWWAPPNVTEGGKEVDALLMFIFWLTTAVFIAVMATLIYCLFRYHRRPGVPAVYSHGNNTLEIVWTTIPAVIFIGLWIWSNDAWWKLQNTANMPPDTLKVEIIAEQYGWHIRYPGDDGILGNSGDHLYTEENKLGIDMNDPAALDDPVVYNEMTIPVGRHVHVLLRSRDVIHAFYVPEFRLYQDIVPGRKITWLNFKTISTGNFAIACSQLCGAGHFNMQAKLNVVSPEDYAAWIEEKNARKRASIQQKGHAMVSHVP